MERLPEPAIYELVLGTAIRSRQVDALNVFIEVRREEAPIGRHVMIGLSGPGAMEVARALGLTPESREAQRAVWNALIEYGLAAITERLERGYWPDEDYHPAPFQLTKLAIDFEAARPDDGAVLRRVQAFGA